MVSVVVAVMVQSNAVELQEGICHLVSWRRQTTVQRDTRNLLGAADVDAFAFLDISEIDGINAAAWVRNNGRLHMSDESPLRRAEEGVYFDVRGTGSGAKSSILVLDQ